jgi:peptide/nickel transport system permease protein
MSARSVRLELLRRAVGDAARHFFRNRLAVIGVAIIVLYGVAAFVYPIAVEPNLPSGVYDPVTGFDPDVIHPSQPGPGHLLGTDSLGRDVFAQILAGARPTWILSVVAALMTAVTATFIGAVSAAFRGWVDATLARVSDAFLLLPAPIFMLLIGSGDLSQRIGPISFGLIYGLITGVGAGAIVLRAQALKVMASPFIDAARVAGAGRWRLVFRHVLPHLYPLAALYMMLAVVGAVVADAFATWLGQTGTRVNWGTVVYYGVNFPSPITGEIAWNVVLAPSLVLSVFAAGFYLISVGLRDIADPRYRAEGRDAMMPNGASVESR